MHSLLKLTLALFLCLAFASVSGQDVPAVKTQVDALNKQVADLVAFETKEQDARWSMINGIISLRDCAASRLVVKYIAAVWPDLPDVKKVVRTYNHSCGTKPADHFRDSTKGISKDGKEAKPSPESVVMPNERSTTNPAVNGGRRSGNEPMEGLDGKAYILEGGTLPKRCWVSLPEFGASYFSSTACGKVPVELASLPDRIEPMERNKFELYAGGVVKLGVLHAGRLLLKMPADGVMRVDGLLPAPVELAKLPDRIEK